MIKTVLMVLVLTTGLLLLLQPAKANWVCGPDECMWVPHVHVVVPSFAVTWAPPPRPSCFWRRGIFGRWRFVCP